LSSGSWGGVLEAEDENELRAFAARGPVVITGTADIEMGEMLAGLSVPADQPIAGKWRRTFASLAGALS
jgi:hypothetical protein